MLDNKVSSNCLDVFTPMVFAVDMDDTLNDTHGFIYNGMLRHYTERGMKDKAQYIQEEHRKGTSSLVWREDVRKDISDVIIDTNIYIKNAYGSNLMDNGFISLMREIKLEYPDHFKPVIVTHRGFDPEAATLTEIWLYDNGIEDLFDVVHALDPKVKPNKIEFLKETYPGYSIRLLDDNPLARTNEVYPHMPELIIYDKISNLPAYQNQRKYTTNLNLVYDVVKTIEGK